MSTTGPGLPDPARLLDAWEAAAAAPEVARGCAVLAAVGAVDAEEALDLPLGVLGDRALCCHIETFGAAVDGVFACPACHSRLEVELDLDGLLPVAGAAIPDRAHRSVELGGGKVTVRAPTVRDLLDAGGADDPRTVILARCARWADGDPLDDAGLSAADVAAIDAELEAMAGAGMTTLRATCPVCAGRVAVVLDPGALLWDRVRAAAPALLADVARLAAAFGWREADVLALPTARRRAYLELADG